MADLNKISAGKDLPAEVNVIIEIPKGSRVKYEVDKEYGVVKVDRILSSAVGYPANYGYVPQTLFDDGDPLDVVIVSNFELAPGVMVKARPVGVMKMIDNGEVDDKIICVISDDPQFKNVKNIFDISPQTLNEIAEFFGTYKNLEGKKTQVDGFDERKAAFGVIERSVRAYKEEAVV